MEIMPKVHLIPDVIANPYLIVDSDGLTLIDAGLPGSHKKILKYIVDRDYSPRDIVRIVITHADIDHVGGLAALKRTSSAKVCASALEAEAISKGVPSRPSSPASLSRRLLMAIIGRFLKPAPVQVDEILADGQMIPALGGLLVLSTPGHTPGHISLFSPSTGVLFVGDSIVSRDSGLIGSVPANTWNQEQAIASVRKQAALGARVVCSGHGPVVIDAIGKMPAL
jgi:glyoxylase-like metal-dependent hydrolase (beta-lactamase superfamily II)